MENKKLPDDFVYLEEMYQDDYYPKFLVDKLKNLLKEVVTFIEKGNYTLEDLQNEFDRVIDGTNELQEEFEENNSEMETVARDSIFITVEQILDYFEIDIDSEEAIRNRDW